ncbi:MAG: alpha/beta hydrolase fold domain-containing protein [Pseudoclavibacter sp.]
MEHVLRDVVYSRVQGFRPMRLDLHLPAGPASTAAGAPLPAVVFIHGGGWRLGDRGTFAPKQPELTFERIASAGFGVVSIEYRLSGEAVFPAQLDDVRAALAWVREAGPGHGLDPDRVVLWGESAGGHLAALGALDAAGIPDAAAGRALQGPDATAGQASPGPDASVAMPARPTVVGVIDWYGPADLPAFARHVDPVREAELLTDADSREAQLLGGPIGERDELARAASPAVLLREAARSAASNRSLPPLPPFHLAHGTRDAFVPIAQSESLHDALVAAGAEVDFERVEGANHLWIDLDDPESVFASALAFARRVNAAHHDMMNSSCRHTGMHDRSTR